ncbi:hypothetical protein [Jiella sp. M17.18]|uniref:hypothetical protein n=1 Tax=Jiella sp. M17.18 TaxID=3234247 RepID=UPI0034DE9045
MAWRRAKTEPAEARAGAIGEPAATLPEPPAETIEAKARRALYQLQSHSGSLRPDVSAGSAALGLGAVGALALGAAAVGAVAVGAFAIGRLSVGRARIGEAEIGRLRIGRLEVDELVGPAWRLPRFGA